MFIQLRLPFLSQERDILADLVVTVIPSRLFSMVTEAEAVFPLLFADLEAVCQVESYIVTSTLEDVQVAEEPLYVKEPVKVAFHNVFPVLS